MADRSLLGAVLLFLAAGCAAPAPTTTAAPDPAAAVRASLDLLNSTAGGDVAVQQQVLRGLVDPARAAEQDACAPATVTVRIDPVLDRLAPAPTVTATATGAGTGQWTASVGDRYRVPVLLEVYTDGLRTGTDLAGLDVVVIDGTAYTAPLCLR